MIQLFSISQLNTDQQMPNSNKSVILPIPDPPGCVQSKGYERIGNVLEKNVCYICMYYISSPPDHSQKKWPPQGCLQ